MFGSSSPKEQERKPSGNDQFSAASTATGAQHQDQAPQLSKFSYPKFAFYPDLQSLSSAIYDVEATSATETPASAAIATKIHLGQHYLVLQESKLTANEEKLLTEILQHFPHSSNTNTWPETFLKFASSNLKNIPKKLLKIAANASDSNGKPVLRVACSYRYSAESVQTLINMGADLNTPEQNLALYDAIDISEDDNSVESCSVLKCLLDNGARTDISHETHIASFSKREVYKTQFPLEYAQCLSLVCDQAVQLIIDQRKYDKAKLKELVKQKNYAEIKRIILIAKAYEGSNWWHNDRDLVTEALRDAIINGETGIEKLFSEEGGVDVDLRASIIIDDLFNSAQGSTYELARLVEEYPNYKEEFYKRVNTAALFLSFAGANTHNLQDFVKIFPEHKEEIYKKINTEANFLRFTGSNVYQLANLVAIFPEHKEEFYVRVDTEVNFSKFTWYRISLLEVLVKTFPEHKENFYQRVTSEAHFIKFIDGDKAKQLKELAKIFPEHEEDELNRRFNSLPSNRESKEAPAESMSDLSILGMLPESSRKIIEETINKKWIMLDLSNEPLWQWSPEQFKAFGKALKGRPIPNLALARNNLDQWTEKQSKAFAEALKGSPFTCLYLMFDNRISQWTEKKIKAFFGETLKESPIRGLVLQSNFLHQWSKEQITAFGEAIKESQITSLDFSTNQLDQWSKEQNQAFFEALKGGWVAKLHLGWHQLNEWSKEKFTAFLEALMESQITSLDLTACILDRWSMEQITAFGEALKKSRITSLDLSLNRFAQLSEEQINAFGKCHQRKPDHAFKFNTDLPRSMFQRTVSSIL